MNFIGYFFLFPLVKKIANRLRFVDVSTMSFVAPFLEHGVVVVGLGIVVVVVVVVVAAVIIIYAIYAFLHRHRS